MTSISVVIPAYNDLTATLVCITSLQRNASRKIEVEFLVQDDASPNTILPLLIPPCAASTERNAYNLGFPGNCNAGARRAKGDVLFFVNQDVSAIEVDMDGRVYSPGWDIALAEAFNDPQVGIVGAKLVFPDFRVQNAGGQYDAHCQPFHIGLGYSNHRYWETNTPRAVSWTTGAALAIRRELFMRLGGFDEGYIGGYFEDVDLCARARVAGYAVWYEPRCQLVHAVGTTGGNPNFMTNAKRFHDKWVATNKLKPDTTAIKMGWW